MTLRTCLSCAGVSGMMPLKSDKTSPPQSVRLQCWQPSGAGLWVTWKVHAAMQWRCLTNVDQTPVTLQVMAMLATDAGAGLRVTPLPEPALRSAMPPGATRFALEFQYCLERVRWTVGAINSYDVPLLGAHFAHFPLSHAPCPRSSGESHTPSLHPQLMAILSWHSDSGSGQMPCTITVSTVSRGVRRLNASKFRNCAALRRW